MGQRIFVIGASLSGIDALCDLVAQLPESFPAPIFITQHVAPHSPGMLPSILAKAGRLPASHPKTGELIVPGQGHIYVAPPDRHMLLRRGYVALSHGPRENQTRPAIDPLFRSAAIAYGPAVVAAVLTGQLDDGTAGLLTVKDFGGTTVVQDPTEATAASMPESALQYVEVDHCCKLREMAALFRDLANDDPAAAEAPTPNKLTEVEDRIADGIFNVRDWWLLEQMSAPSGFNCPDCRSALYEIKDARFLRFRCRSGHAYSAQTLLSGQADSRETQFSSIFGALIEEVTLAKRIRARLEPHANHRFLKDLQDRADILEREAAEVCEWLHEMAGLVQPEPSARMIHGPEPRSDDR